MAEEKSQLSAHIPPWCWVLLILGLLVKDILGNKFVCSVNSCCSCITKAAPNVMLWSL